MDDEARKLQDELLKDAWMIRPCQDFLEEYKECKSLKGRFHQYFTTGETKECKQWKQDYELCKEYRGWKSMESYLKLLHHERERIVERVKSSRDNDIWEYRTEPPEDWAKPLPASLLDTPLPAEEAKRKMCVIQ